MSIADKLTTIAENTTKVYDAGYEAGKAEGGGGSDRYEEGYTNGQQAEYDRFWDTFQANGNRTNYRFNGSLPVGSGHLHNSFWSMHNFYPKYDITPVESMYGMFYRWTRENHPDVTDWDLVDRLKMCGVVLDTTGLTSPAGAFDNNHFTHLPYCDFSNCTSDTYTVGAFEYCDYVEKIDGIKVAETTYIYRWFVRCFELVDCPFEGVIGSNGLNLSWSTKLSHDSLMSIINALEAKTSGTFTVTLGTTNLAKLTDAEKAIATQKGWTLA